MHIVRIRQHLVILLKRFIQVFVCRIVIQLGKEPVSLFSEFLVHELAGTTNRIRLDIDHISQTAWLGKSQSDNLLTQ